MNYAHTVTVTVSFHDAVALIRAALQDQGFGILTEIDVRATFDDKLGAESSRALGDYLILGACNPALAERSLSAEPDMGLLLPCNVVVRRQLDAVATTIQAINPQVMVDLSGSAEMKTVADEADARLLAALKAVESGIEA